MKALSFKREGRVGLDIKGRRRFTLAKSFVFKNLCLGLYLDGMRSVKIEVTCKILWKNSPKSMKPSSIIHLTYEHHGRSFHWFFLESLIEKGHGFVFGASLIIFLGFFVLRFEGLYRCRAIIGKRNDFASEGIMQDIESLYTFKELFNINNCCTFFCSSCSLSETETLLWTRQMLWTNIPRLSKSREMVVGN